ncbi:MAG: YgjV family protein [Clostridia bacterium]|nr:YgjV family protein [Clostridia bacterium]
MLPLFEQWQAASPVSFEWVTQGIGYIGLLFGVLSCQLKEHKRILFCKTMNELVFGIQYILLGATTGLIMNFFSCVRNTVFTAQVKRGKSTLPAQIGFSILFLTLGLLFRTESLVACLLVIFSKIGTTVAYGLKNTTLLRFLTMPTYIGWLVYDVICHSDAGVLNQIFVTVSLTIAIIRLDIIPFIKRKKEAKQS